jgi:thioredoxin-related protein
VLSSLQGPSMKTILLFIFPVILLFDVLHSEQRADSANTVSEQRQKFDPERDAKRDIQNAVLLAQKTHKRILLDVGGEWCIWCHRLDSLFLQNKDLAEYLNKHYVVVKINMSKENENRELLSKYPKVAGYPHLFVLDKNGKLMHSQDTGELEYPKNYPIKGHDKKKVFIFLKKWSS